MAGVGIYSFVLENEKFGFVICFVEILVYAFFCIWFQVGSARITLDDYWDIFMSQFYEGKFKEVFAFGEWNLFALVFYYGVIVVID